MHDFSPSPNRVCACHWHVPPPEKLCPQPRGRFLLSLRGGPRDWSRVSGTVRVGCAVSSAEVCGCGRFCPRSGSSPCVLGDARRAAQVVRLCPDREGAQGPRHSSEPALGSASKSQGQVGPNEVLLFSRSVAVSHHRQWLAVWVVSTPSSYPHLKDLLRPVPGHSAAQHTLGTGCARHKQVHLDSG